MQNLEKDGYSRDEILDVILSRGVPRVVDFKFVLVDGITGQKITDLVGVESASLNFDSNAQIKRTARMSVSQETYGENTYMTWRALGYTNWSEI